MGTATVAAAAARPSSIRPGLVRVRKRMALAGPASLLRVPPKRFGILIFLLTRGLACTPQSLQEPARYSADRYQCRPARQEQTIPLRGTERSIR